jgi:hypothetical protein
MHPSVGLTDFLLELFNRVGALIEPEFFLEIIGLFLGGIL